MEGKWGCCDKEDCSYWGEYDSKEEAIAALEGEAGWVGQYIHPRNLMKNSSAFEKLVTRLSERCEEVFIDALYDLVEDDKQLAIDFAPWIRNALDAEEWLEKECYLVTNVEKVEEEEEE